MFELKGKIARNVSVDPEDSANVKFALTSLGYYNDDKSGLSPYADDQLFTAVKSFQKENDLKVDGVLNVNGPTQAKIKDKLKENEKAGNAFGDFWKNYWDMREADTIGADNYFHCKANFEATQRGWDGSAGASFLSNMREAGDLLTDSFTSGIITSGKDVMKDQAVNLYGRNAARTGGFSSAREACAIYRPKGLNEKY
jgi:hypothetical protein